MDRKWPWASETEHLLVELFKGLRLLPPTPDFFWIFWIFRKMSIFGTFRWDLGSGGVCNRLGMAVGFT